MYFLFGENEQNESMSKHRRKSHTILKPFSDISLTRHPDTCTVHKTKNKATAQHLTKLKLTSKT